MKFFEKHTNIILILFFGLVIRLGLSFFGTLQLDHGTFIAWSNSLLSDGFKNFYNGWSDYLPGYLYLLWSLAKINTLGVIPETLLYKLPAILSDLLTGIIIYGILSKSKGTKTAAIGTILYIFNPAIISNSTLWGQVDSLTALTSMLAVYLLPSHVFLSAISISVGTLIKPQTAFIAPVVLFLMIKNKNRIFDYFIYGAVGLAVFVAAYVPFWNHATLVQFIIERLGLSLSQYPHTSVNAFNFWGLFGFWKEDRIYYQIAGYLLVAASTLFLSIKLWKVKNAQYFLMAFIFLSSFMFFTRMHERHLLPVFAPLIIASMENPLLMSVYAGLSLTYVANLYYAYIWITKEFKEIFSDIAIKFMEVVNVGLTLFSGVVIAKGLKTEWTKFKEIAGRFKKSKSATVSEYKLPKIKLPPKAPKFILFGILLFAFATRIYALGSPGEMYFDEVYHAFTGKVMLSSEAAKAWEWWNTPPEGFAYEWTHPPFAKVGMAFGMLIFGQNSFGWRIPGAILGLGAVYLVYLLARNIFKDEWIGLLAAGVFSLDGLALEISRIGMNDSYMLFFVLLSLYLYIKDRNFLSALSFGFAISSKWSAIWAVPIFAVIMLSYKKKLNLSYLWFFTMPFVIYLASYLQLFTTGHDFGTWWGMQQQMWWYHTQLDADHPYTSQWWTWPFLIRPIYLYTSEEIAGSVARIYAFGNPLVFWFGVASVATTIIYSYLEKSKKLGLIAFAYLIFFVPWAMSPRIMFLYHYLPSIPFMCIAIAYVLRRNPGIIKYFFVLTILVFIYFYPHFAGLKVPLWLDESYYWVSSWR